MPDHENCPMAASQARRTAVDHRHDDATGVDHGALEHHFLLARDGGSIRLEVRDVSQTPARDRIREHLRGIARSFAAADFSTPMLVHDQVPPGVEVMRQRSTAIRYTYSDTDKGGIIAISTDDSSALDAVHEFLRFQVRDHATGDPTE
jgi:hypothetical protein